MTTEELQQRVAELERDLDGAYQALREAGETARSQRERYTRLSADRFRMAQALTDVVQDEQVPERLRESAREALEGPDDE
jgi:hypothetical protein